MTIVAERKGVEAKAVKRMEVWNADLGRRQGSEQGGVRPVVILQNDIGNKYSPTVTIAPMTSSPTKKRMPTHVNAKASEIDGLGSDSTILVEQMITIDKNKLDFKVLDLPSFIEWEVERAMLIQLGIQFNK